MLLSDEPRTAPGELDALIEEARQRTRKRRRRIAVVLLVAAAGVTYLVGSGGGGGSARMDSSGHGAPLPGGAARGEAQSIAATRLAVLPNLSYFALLAPGEGWAVNGVSFYLTNDDGAHWKTLVVPKLTGGDVAANLFSWASVGRNDIFLSYSTGRSYGSCTHSSGAGPSKHVYTIGSVARSINRGRTWQLSTLPGCVFAASLSFLNARTGFALATPTGRTLRPELLVTRDGGRTWRRVAVIPFFGTIDFATATDFWGLASQVERRYTGPDPAPLVSTLYHTTNGGLSWQRQPICTTAAAPGTYTVCGPPHFFGPNTGVLPVTTIDRHIGRAWLTVERTTNGGRTWSGTRLPSTPATQPILDTGTAGRFVAVSTTNWIALIGPRLYETTDAGSHWTTLVPKPSTSNVFEYGFDFVSARDGWMIEAPITPAGANHAPSVFEYTTDGGRTWHPLAKQ